MGNFKVGDRVKYVRDVQGLYDPTHASPHVGKVGTVVAEEVDPYVEGYFRIVEVQFDDGSEHGFFEWRLEKIEPEVKPEPKALYYISGEVPEPMTWEEVAALAQERVMKGKSGFYVYEVAPKAKFEYVPPNKGSVKEVAL
jgi:hypothetical protein